MVNLYESDNFDKSVKDVEWGKWYATAQIDAFAVIIPRIGALVAYQDKQYYVMQTTTYQEDSGNSHSVLEYPKAVITTKCQLLRIDDEGNEMGEESIWVDSTEITSI